MNRDETVTLVARNIEAVMAHTGTNAAEVARRSGINSTGVYDILSGKSRSPRLDTLNKIAVNGLGVSLGSLLVKQTDDALKQELSEITGLMSADDRRRLLAVARAFVAETATV